VGVRSSQKKRAQTLNVKKCSALFEIKEMYIKIITEYHFTPSDWQKLLSEVTPMVSKDAEQ
jgi:hypothetical protein